MLTIKCYHPSIKIEIVEQISKIHVIKVYTLINVVSKNHINLYGTFNKLCNLKLLIGSLPLRSIVNYQLKTTCVPILILKHKMLKIDDNPNVCVF